MSLNKIKLYHWNKNKLTEIKCTKSDNDFLVYSKIHQYLNKLFEFCIYGNLFL